MERIDTHTHVIPQVWRKYCCDHGHDRPDGMPAIPAWTPEAHIDLMKQLRISKSILSITSPGTHLKPGDDKLACQITRETNEEIAQICRDHPKEFAFFASLPLPNVDGSIEEIDYALDKLGAVGFALMTNAHGYYLGDPHLEKVFAKLNERKAVVFLHPTSCHSPESPDAKWPLSKYPAPLMEFFFDTTRAVTNLIMSGTLTRYSNITFLLSHCGGTLPPLIERIAAFTTLVLSQKDSINSNQLKELFKSRFYFDLAGFPFPDQIHALLRMTDTSRLLYGSDYPYTPGPLVQRLGSVMDEQLKVIFNDDDIRKISSGNAKKLLNLS